MTEMKRDNFEQIAKAMLAVADLIKPFDRQDQSRILASVACLYGVEEEVSRRVTAASASVAAMTRRDTVYEPQTDNDFWRGR